MDPRREHRLDNAAACQRFDVARMQARPTLTSQGFLRARANLTRVGVLAYARADGTTRLELRHPEDVFDPESLATLSHAPLTDLHPTAMVGPENVRALQVGIVSSATRADGFVAGEVLVQDAGAIRDVQARKRVELSAGYSMTLDETPGEFNGVRYDARQRNIRYNHVAMGPRGWGRAGGDVAFRLDGTGAASLLRTASDLGAMLRVRLDAGTLSDVEAAATIGMDEHRLDELIEGFDTPSPDEVVALSKLINVLPDELFALLPSAKRNDRRDLSLNGVTNMKITVRIDGVDYVVEVPDVLAANFQAGMARTDARAVEAEKKTGELQGRLDAATAACVKAEADLKIAIDPATVEAAVTALVTLRTDSALILGTDANLEGKSAREIKEACIKHVSPEARVDGASDAYVDGRFDFLVEQSKASTPAPAKGVHSLRAPVKREDANEPDPHDSKAAHERMVSRNAKAWQTPKAGN